MRAGHDARTGSTLIRAVCDERFISCVQATDTFRSAFDYHQWPDSQGAGFGLRQQCLSGNIARANSSIGRALQLILNQSWRRRPAK